MTDSGALRGMMWDGSEDGSSMGGKLVYFSPPRARDIEALKLCKIFNRLIIIER